jgi:NitT/TauT family transport system permease protein
LASNAVEPLEDLAEEPEAASPGTTRISRFVTPGTPLLALVCALLAALAIHVFLPNQQAPPPGWMDALPWWQHPYPMLLGILLVGTLVWATAQWIRPSLGRLYFAYAPRIAGVWWVALLVALWRRLPFANALGAWWVALLVALWRLLSLATAPLVAGAVVCLGIGELITVKWAWLPFPFFPGPDDVLGALIEDRGKLFVSTWHSLVLLLSSYLAGVGAGLVSGVLIGWFPACRYWGMPIMKVVGPIPATALVPLAMVLFPKSMTAYSGGALIAFAVWFPMTLLTSSGIANVRLSYLDVARTLGAGRLFLIFRVAIPAALPNIFLGLFAGLYGSFLTLIVAETVGVKAGLGHYLLEQKGYAEYAKVYASLVIMAVFFSTLLTVLFRIRDRVLSWQKGIIKW